MHLYFLACLLVLCHGQDNIDDLRKQFGAAVTELWQRPNNSVPIPTTSTSRPGAPTWQGGTGWGDERGCVCVPYYSCDPDTNKIITDGKRDGFGQIDIRFGSQGENQRKCEHPLDVCCDPPEQLPNPSSTEVPSSTTGIPTAPPPVGPIKCGIRNPKGVGFEIKVNVNNEAEYAEFPWMVEVLRTDYNYEDNNVNKNLALCGGSLIHQSVVLTGAHCVDKLSPADIKIRAGEWDTQTGREQYPYQERQISRIILHESFNPKTVYYDVALLVLNKPVEWAPNVRPVCLPEQDEVFNNRDCFVTGWGKNSFGKLGQLSVILKKIQVPMVPKNKCESDLRNTRLGKHFNLHHSFVCAGGEEGKDACTGDGGGPLVCPAHAPQQYKQSGIVAWGIGCGQKDVPGVYGNVAHFRNWIDHHMTSLKYGTSTYTI